ncbi:MAG: YcxB family protein [Bacilli bacterium]
MIQVAVHYTEQELRTFFQFQLLVKNKIRYLYFGFATLFIGGASYFLIATPKVIVGLVLILFAIMLLVMFPIQIKLLVRKQSFKEYEGPKQVLTLSDQGIIHEINGKSHEYLWDSILEINETKRCFYLYISKYGALIVNKSSFIEGGVEELTLLFKRHHKKIKRYKYL